MQKRSYITPSGLSVDGIIQVFTWERDTQRIFAKHVGRNAKILVNVGYGLGFAHQIFSAMPHLKLHLIEASPSILSTALRKNCNSSTQFHLGLWEAKLADLLTKNTTIFFDAFPVDQTFGYRPRDFKTYIAPLLRVLEKNDWSNCFFVAFDSRPIDFGPPSGVKVSRVLNFPLQRRLATTRVTHSSLYRVAKR